MNDKPKGDFGVFYWMGRSVYEMSREELIAALTHLADEIRRLQGSAEIRARALGRVEMMKRGEA